MKQALIRLFLMLIILYFYSFGDRVLDLTYIFQSTPAAIMFAYFLLPSNLLHNLFGINEPFKYELYYILCYWSILLYLMIQYIKKRKNYILLLIFILLSVSMHGCEEYSNSIWEYYR